MILKKLKQLGACNPSILGDQGKRIPSSSLRNLPRLSKLKVKEALGEGPKLNSHYHKAGWTLKGKNLTFIIR